MSDKRDQSGTPCCASFHGTPQPSAAQFRKCGGCPVAQAAQEQTENDDEEEWEDD